MVTLLPSSTYNDSFTTVVGIEELADHGSPPTYRWDDHHLQGAIGSPGLVYVKHAMYI